MYVTLWVSVRVRVRVLVTVMSVLGSVGSAYRAAVHPATFLDYVSMSQRRAHACLTGNVCRAVVGQVMLANKSN